MDKVFDCIKLKTDKSKLCINGLFILLSITLIVLSDYYHANDTSIMYMLQMSIAMLGLIIPLINIIFRSKKYIYMGTDSVVNSYTVGFNLDSKQLLVLQNALNAGDLKLLKHCIGKSNADVQVDIVYSEDGHFGAYRIHFYSHQFEVVKEWNYVFDYPMNQLVESLQDVA